MKIKKTAQISLTSIEKALIVPNKPEISLDFHNSFMNPAWSGQRKPLPMIANVKKGEPAPESRIPVFHTNTPNDKQRITLAREKARIEAEYEKLAFHAARRMRHN